MSRTSSQMAVNELITNNLLDSGDKDRIKEIHNEFNSHEERMSKVIN